MRRDLRFRSGTGACAAWHYTGETDFADAEGRPCVVMAHGFGATRDCGLDGYAERLSAAGLDVLAFDYRGFDITEGPPAAVSPRAQRADYHAAAAHARTLDGVDPERIVAWGVSLAGGHVFEVAAEDPRIAAVIAVTPAPDGTASMLNLLRGGQPAALAAVAATGLADAIGVRLGRAPRTVPISGPPGTSAILTAPGAHEAYAGIAGPAWRNETPARIALTAGLDRPIRHAGRLRCPVLVQVADRDRTAPPAAARKAAYRARADVRGYPCDHFDIYPGAAWFEPAVEHQLLFLRRHLGGVA